MDNYYIYIKQPEKKKLSDLFWRYIPFVLFIFTVFSTLFAGAMMQNITPFDILLSPRLLLKGAPFAIPLMVILLTHEMGHYITSRIHRVESTLPYFIPFPNYIGTFGAVIKMKSPMRDRSSLIDIGAAGPLAGFVLSVIAVAWGLAHAETIPIDKLPPETFWNARIAFGPNIAFWALAKLIGPASFFTGDNLLVNPIMDAGWLGLFVTNLNLMPAGQLDGGHIAYALFGQNRARKLAKAVVGILILFGLPGFLSIVSPDILYPFWPGYAVWGVLVTIIGLGHPPPMDPYQPLNAGRKWIGILCLFVWLITFCPIPFAPY